MSKFLTPNTNTGLVNHAYIVLFVYSCTVLGPPLLCLFLTEPLPTAFTKVEVKIQITKSPIIKYCIIIWFILPDTKLQNETLWFSRQSKYATEQDMKHNKNIKVIPPFPKLVFAKVKSGAERRRKIALAPKMPKWSFCHAGEQSWFSLLRNGTNNTVAWQRKGTQTSKKLYISLIRASKELSLTHASKALNCIKMFQGLKETILPTEPKFVINCQQNQSLSLSWE